MEKVHTFDKLSPRLPSTMPLELSIDEARKLVLHCQRILSPYQRGNTVDATEQVIGDLGYIQIDTISVIVRAHHHTLWNRNPRYRPEQLDRLLENRKVFEYWSHAAAYLPMRDYRFSLPRMQQEVENPGHWYQRNAKMMKHVMERIRSEGPLMVRDFADPRPGKTAMWDWKPAKIALEQLFMEGSLMTTRRQGFHKVYDFPENVLPGNIDTTTPTQEELARFLIRSFLSAHGLGNVAEIAYLRKGMRPLITQVAKEMLAAGELHDVKAADARWLALPELMHLLDKPLARTKVKILSPFDNLVIQRKRMRQLFDFDYQIECYVPEKKRRFGYFVLPVIWQGRFGARMDCKAHRDKGVFEVRKLFVEQRTRAIGRMAPLLYKELMAFAKFNGCSRIVVGDQCDQASGKLLQQCPQHPPESE